MRADRIDDFAKIVRRNVGCHAHRDPSATVDEQIWESTGENRGFGPGIVVVRNEIDRVLVHVGHERGAEMLEARFGVTHGRGRIAFDGAEIALTLDQGFTHRP